MQREGKMINSLTLSTAAINAEARENKTNRQQIVLFMANSFMEREVERLRIDRNINRSSFFREALRDLIARYRHLGIEPFEIDNIYNDTEHTYARRYSFVIDSELEEEFTRLKNLYREHDIFFNRSHFIRWAVFERLGHFLLDETF